MASDSLITFSEAVEASDRTVGPPSILLGNGFSIDWRDTFNYKSLYEDATFDGLSVSKEELFGRLGTLDFEVVINSLNVAADLADLYETCDGDLSEFFRADVDSIRSGLADVIARRHPNRAKVITSDEVAHARTFLSHFGKIFTLNYDLLLYWVVNRNSVAPYDVPVRDGFEWPTASGPDELIWKPRPTQGEQSIYYLHGALHYFYESGKLHKLGYGFAEPLIDQIRDRIEGGQYPRIVTEGKSADKLSAIRISPYLTHCRQVFQELEGDLFIHGVSLAPNDDHILSLLESDRSDIRAVYVGIHGNPDSDDNDEIIRRTKRMARRRGTNGRRKLKTFFYDSSSARVWR